MASQALEAYLAELKRELPLPAAERDEAIEEIAGHVADATADLVERGIGAEDAERRSLARFGPPAALADELARARRTPRNVLEAAGAAVRVTIVTGLWALIVSWAVVAVAFMVLSLAIHIVAGWLGTVVTPFGSGQGLNPMLTAIVTGSAAYAIGRALPSAIGLAARRRVAALRPYVLIPGAAIAAAIGWFGIADQFTPTSALLTALLPAWFALGVLRPQLLPAWFAGTSRAAMGVLVVAVVLLSVSALSAGTASAPAASASVPVPADSWSPTREYARIGPIHQLHDPVIRTQDVSGAGNVYHYEWHLADAAALAGWTSIHLQVWLGVGDEGTHGRSALDPRVNQPIGTASVAIAGERMTAVVDLPVVPESTHYLVALVGTDSTGRTWQLTIPDDLAGRWEGSVWEFLTLERPW